MRKVYITTIIVLALPAMIVISCSKSNDDPTVCDGVTNKSFAADVNPLIQTFCNQAACHDAGSSNGVGPLTNYTQVFNARVAIRGAVQSGLMPQNATLTTAQKNSIICWIDSGAPNN
ncbi:MAG TPA: hypothetical protein VIZ28_05085 [Chitinophagaceae bacterium]